MRVGSLALAMVAALIAVLAVPAVWARTLVFDENRFIEVAAQTLDRPEVRSYVSTQLAAEAVQAIEQSVSKLGLPPIITSPLMATVRTQSQPIVDQVMATNAFTVAWQATTRAAHRSLLAELDNGGISGAVSVDLLPALTVVLEAMRAKVPQLFPKPLPTVTSTTDPVVLRNQLSASLGVQISPTRGVVRIAEPAGFEAMARSAQLFKAGAIALPLLALFLVFAGLVVARNRRRFLLTFAAALVGLAAVSLLALGILPGIALPAVSLGSARKLATAGIDIAVAALQVRFLVAAGVGLGLLGLSAWLIPRTP